MLQASTTHDEDIEGILARLAIPRASIIILRDVGRMTLVEIRLVKPLHAMRE